MKELVCIVCPRGCTLQIEQIGEEIAVTGNGCKRGVAFATSEMKNPMRTICSTVKTTDADVPVIPVRVSADIPKQKIFDVMAAINAVTVTKPLGRGDTVIQNVLGLGVDVIVTSDILKQSHQ